MLTDHDAPLQCKRHPAQTVEGICALCLRERLNQLMCVHCCNSPSVCSFCSCSASRFVMKPLEGAINIGSVGTISTLIEMDTMARRSLSDKQVKGGLYRSNWEDKNSLPIRRSRSVSVSSSSNNVNYRDWELRRFGRSGTTRSLQSVIRQIFEGDKENRDMRGSRTAGALKFATKTTPLKEKFVKIGNIASLTGSPGKLKKTASDGARQNALHEFTTESRITTYASSLQKEDSMQQAYEFSMTDMHSQQKQIPQLVRSADAQLIKSKSTGNASSSDGSKATPEFWTKFTSPNSGKLKKLNIFARIGSRKRIADNLTLTQDSTLTEMRSPRIAIHNPAESSWAFLGCINGVKEESSLEVVGSPTCYSDDQVSALGEFNNPVNGMQGEKSISSLISMELPYKQTFSRSQSRSGWNRTLFSPVWTFK
eukprot:c27404_g1_i1 orf=640-1911(+)